MSRTYLVISSNDFLADSDLALDHTSDMQNIAVRHLDIFHLELGLAVDREHASVVLLSTLFGVKVGLVE